MISENLILVKTDIACSFILSFLLYYSFMYCKNVHSKRFKKICALALAHVIMGIVTVITVNNREYMPSIINDVCHYIFYITAVMFASEFFLYVLGQTNNIKKEKKYIISNYIILAAFCIEALFIRPIYIDGIHTDYSAGFVMITGFLTAIIYYIYAIVLIIRERKNMPSVITYTIIPIVGISLIGVAIQLKYPEFLFTGANVTIVTIGLFFAVENPAGNYLKKAYIDEMTALKNKNCYNEELQRLIVQSGSEVEAVSKLSYVTFDINNLKKTNDIYGHSVGDELIKTVANIITGSLLNAYGIYRMGGDEIVAIYVLKSREIVQEEINMFREFCDDINKTRENKISVAIGFSEYKEGMKSIHDIADAVDVLMYDNKKSTKQEQTN